MEPMNKNGMRVFLVRASIFKRQEIIEIIYWFIRWMFLFWHQIIAWVHWIFLIFFYWLVVITCRSIQLTLLIILSDRWAIIFKHKLETLLSHAFSRCVDQVSINICDILEKTCSILFIAPKFSCCLIPAMEQEWKR